MPPIDGDLAALCQSCGLCCDGSLFGRVSLETEELASARRSRLRVVASQSAFAQPCAALPAIEQPGDGARQRCSIYEERPRACRAFECRLYDRHRREGGSLEPRLAAVRRVRVLLAELENRASTAAFRELVTRMNDDFARA